VNGSQLYATNQQVAANSTAITNLTNVVNSGANNPAQYSDDATPTTPNGGTPTNDVTLVGAAPGPVQLHNVDAGTQATDAVNLAQLQQVASMIGGGGANAVVYNDSSFTTVTLAGLSGTTITNLAPGALNASSTDAVNGAQLFATNQQVALNTTAITNLSVAISSGAIGPVQYSNDSSPTTPNGGTPTNDLTLVGGSAGPVQLHNVADGVIAAGSTDAINGGQIHELALAVDNAVQYEVDANGNRTNRVVLIGGNPSAAVTITNVAAGVAPTDAVNVAQLDDAVDNAVTLSKNYTDNRVQAVQFDLRRSRHEARAGTAAALAAAGLPQPYEPGKSMFGFAFGTYRGRTALALGASAALDNGETVMKFGLTYDSSDHVGGNFGMGWQF
jgi:autotransporter adhesin